MSMAPGLAPDRGLSLSETLAECCGVVRNVCCDMSAPRGTAFKPSAAPLPRHDRLAIVGHADIGQYNHSPVWFARHRVEQTTDIGALLNNAGHAAAPPS